MQLGDVLDVVDLDVQTASIEINRVEIDSRLCEPGTLFFAVPGESVHGASFVDDAVRRGAVAGGGERQGASRGSPRTRSRDTVARPS